MAFGTGDHPDFRIRAQFRVEPVQFESRRPAAAQSEVAQNVIFYAFEDECHLRVLAGERGAAVMGTEKRSLGGKAHTTEQLWRPAVAAP